MPPVRRKCKKVVEVIKPARRLQQSVGSGTGAVRSRSPSKSASAISRQGAINHLERFIHNQPVQRQSPGGVAQRLASLQRVPSFLVLFILLLRVCTAVVVNQGLSVRYHPLSFNQRLPLSLILSFLLRAQQQLPGKIGGGGRPARLRAG